MMIQLQRVHQLDINKEIFMCTYLLIVSLITQWMQFVWLYISNYT